MQLSFFLNPSSNGQENNYPERYVDVMSVKHQNNKIIYHCAMVEKDGIEEEGDVAKALRKELTK